MSESEAETTAACPYKAGETVMIRTASKGLPFDEPATFLCLDGDLALVNERGFIRVYPLDKLRKRMAY
jgi:hypothetical protein